MPHRRTRLIALAASVVAANVARLDAAQSWLGPGGGSWSDPANWLGTPPDNGDVPWFIRGGDDIDVVLDLSNVTLDGILFNTPGRFFIQPAAPSNSITRTGSGTIDSVRSFPGTPLVPATGNFINATILGSAGLHKIGDGDVLLGAANNYTGGTTI